MGVAFALVGLNVFQLIYWSRQTQKLVDKLMSRNYAEYVQSNQVAETRPALPLVETPLEYDEDLNTLNRQMGML